MVVLGCMINEGDVILPYIFEQGLRIISDGCVEMLNTVVNDVCNLDLLHFSFFLSAIALWKDNVCLFDFFCFIIQCFEYVVVLLLDRIPPVSLYLNLLCS